MFAVKIVVIRNTVREANDRMRESAVGRVEHHASTHTAEAAGTWSETRPRHDSLREERHGVRDLASSAGTPEEAGSRCDRDAQVGRSPASERQQDVNTLSAETPA